MPGSAPEARTSAQGWAAPVSGAPAGLPLALPVREVSLRADV